MTHNQHNRQRAPTNINFTHRNQHPQFQLDRAPKNIAQEPSFSSLPSHRSSIVYQSRDQESHPNHQYQHNILINENNSLRQRVNHLECELREEKQYSIRLRDGSQVKNLKRQLWNYEEERMHLMACKDNIINDLHRKLQVQKEKNRKLQNQLSALLSHNCDMKQPLRTRY